MNPRVRAHSDIEPIWQRESDQHWQGVANTNTAKIRVAHAECPRQSMRSERQWRVARAQRVAATVCNRGRCGFRSHASLPDLGMNANPRRAVFARIVQSRFAVDGPENHAHDPKSCDQKRPPVSTIHPSSPEPSINHAIDGANIVAEKSPACPSMATSCRFDIHGFRIFRFR